VSERRLLERDDVGEEDSTGPPPQPACARPSGRRSCSRTRHRSRAARPARPRPSSTTNAAGRHPHDPILAATEPGAPARLPALQRPEGSLRLDIRLRGGEQTVIIAL
jgi:hypothetical protein